MPFKRTVGRLRDVPSLAAAPDEALISLAENLIALAEVVIDECERNNHQDPAETSGRYLPSMLLSAACTHEILQFAKPS